MITRHSNRALGNGLVVPALAALVVLPSLALAYSGGPPDARTNAPGEITCTQCHSSFPLNSGAGTMTLAGIPEPYVPGTAYTVTVTQSDPDASRWGYEATILESGGASTGVIALLDGFSQTSSAGNRNYVKQTSSGTFNGTTEQASWSFRWTAPAAGAGDVTVYVATNAANGNFLSSGDRIYADSFRFTEQGLTDVGRAPLAVATLMGNFPNPFNPRTAIRFALPEAMPVRLAVYAVDGRLVRTLVQGTRAAGEHEVVWDGLDEAGRGQPSGTYLYVMDAGIVRETGRMTLVR